MFVKEESTGGVFPSAYKMDLCLTDISGNSRSKIYTYTDAFFSLDTTVKSKHKSHETAQH